MTMTETGLYLMQSLRLLPETSLSLTPFVFLMLISKYLILLYIYMAWCLCILFKKFILGFFLLPNFVDVRSIHSHVVTSLLIQIS